MRGAGQVVFVLTLLNPFFFIRLSCPLQAILLGVLVGCCSPLQIVMAVWQDYFLFEMRQTASIICRGSLPPTQQVQILKKVHQMAIIICSGLPHLTQQAEIKKTEQQTAITVGAQSIARLCQNLVN